MIKPRMVQISKGSCIFRGTFRRWQIQLSDLECVTFGRILSLVDEIGAIVVTTNRTFFIDESTHGFFEFANWIDIERVAGKEWYLKAENENIVIRSSDFR
jgi:hypothetical protein